MTISVLFGDSNFKVVNHFQKLLFKKMNCSIHKLLSYLAFPESKRYITSCRKCLQYFKSL